MQNLPKEVIVIFPIILCVFMAAVHAGMINNGDGYKIKHSAWGWAYAGFAALLSWGYGWGGFNWWLFLECLLMRELFFDIPLNRMRKPQLPYLYTTPEVKKIGLRMAVLKGKFIDWCQWKIFGNYPIIYVLLYLAAVIYITGWQLS